MGMLQSGLGGVLPRTPCHAASYPRSQPPLNDERFWLGWLHQIEKMDGGADSLKAAKNEFVSTRDIVYAYLVNQCAMTMATKKGMGSWAWAASLNGDGRSSGRRRRVASPFGTFGGRSYPPRPHRLTRLIQ